MRGVPTNQKKCVICGQMFLPEKPSSKICPRDHFAKCPICGKEFLWNSRQAVPPCSKECRKEQTKRKNLEKYGVEHPMQSKEIQQHHKQAMLDKYGVESPLQSQRIKNKAIETNRKRFGTDWALSNKDIKQKAEETMQERYGGKTTLESPLLRKKVEQTCTERYGCANVLQSSEIRQRITNTNFMKYGVDNPAQNEQIREKMATTRIANNGQYWTPEMQEKMRQTSLARFGVDNPSKNPEIKNKIVQTMIERYGKNYLSYVHRNSANVISNINRTFMKRLEEAGITGGEFEFTGIGPYSYDIALPERKILIEIDPTYTHNTVGNHWIDHGIDKNYHKKKSDAAREAGYRCIHVFDWDDWDSVIELVKPKIHVYARKCKIYKLQPKVADEFLSKYHLQGTVKNQLLCLGLIYEGELVQVMTFGQPRYTKKYYAELLRLCTKPGIAVVGGSSKLFSFATKKLEVENIISYCDLAKFNGDVYEKIGMKFSHYTEPQEIWSKNDQKITANLLRQRGYDQLFNASYGKGTSNNDLMLANGWLPVYDCGQAVYSF